MRPGGKIKECAGKLFRRIGARLKKGAVLSTGAVLIASQVLSVVPAPTAAYAASSETITRGERVNYGGFYMYNSTTSEGTPAICLDPGKRHPLDATTATAQLPSRATGPRDIPAAAAPTSSSPIRSSWPRSSTTAPADRATRRRRAKGLWNFNWYDGTALDYSKMLAIQHVALSALSKCSSQYGMQGTTAAFRNWCYKTVLYYIGDANSGLVPREPRQAVPGILSPVLQGHDLPGQLRNRYPMPHHLPQQGQAEAQEGELQPRHLRQQPLLFARGRDLRRLLRLRLHPAGGHAHLQRLRRLQRDRYRPWHLLRQGDQGGKFLRTR